MDDEGVSLVVLLAQLLLLLRWLDMPLLVDETEDEDTTTWPPFVVCADDLFALFKAACFGLLEECEKASAKPLEDEEDSVLVMLAELDEEDADDFGDDCEEVDESESDSDWLMR